MLSVLNKIKHYSLKKSTPVSLKYLFNYGTDFKNDNIFHHSQFLHQELPIRIAKRILNLQELPYELNNYAGMQNIHDEYVSSFKKLTSIKYPVDIKDCDNYVKLLEELKKNHNNVEHDIARCLNSFKNRFSDNYHIYSELIDKKLSIFYESRISIRILTGHHIALKNSHITDKNIGIIYRFKLEEILNNCINEATNVMNQKYLKVPKVIVKSLDQREITHIPNHLHYVSILLML